MSNHRLLQLVVLLVCGSALNACARSPSAQASSAGTAPASLPAASPARSDGLQIKGRAYAFNLRTAACEDTTPEWCDGPNALAIADSLGRPIATLKLATVGVDKQHLLFEGGLGTAQFVNEGQTLIVSDINADKIADLAIRNGSNAGYGGASYDVYLFDPMHRKFVFNRELSQLTEDPYSGMFRIQDGQIGVGAKSGCCDSEDERYVLVEGKPKLVKQVISSTSADTGIRTITTRTLVADKWEIKKSSE